MLSRLYWSLLTIAVLNLAACQSYTSQVTATDKAFVISHEDGRRLKVSPYGNEMIRLQSVQNGQDFYSNNHYQMVEKHDWQHDVKMTQTQSAFVFTSPNIRVEIDRSSLAATFFMDNNNQAVLKEKRPVQWNGSKIKASFKPDPTEHYTALGHGYYARANSIDLKGQVVSRNYGAKPIEQAPLLVPFYMSNKGYGVFLNSTFTNTFSFSSDGEYSIEIDDLGFNGRMDYFFIAGPKLPRVLDNYTQLTGRPRLPQKAMFGLQLSDKGHDHNSNTPSDMNWWKQKINEHRAAGYPLDHVINDNRWRAAGGKRCESKIDWDSTRYPNPSDYQKWLSQNGLVITLDFNRCIAQYSEGWQASFNIPQTGEIEFPKSAPDLTNPEFRKWFWNVFYKNALAPNKGFPGDALWIDEFDEQGHAPKDMVLSNGLSSGEMRNYWFFLIAKALVEQGWDKSDMQKRPFVWVRGMTAGAQRFATLWSGDIYPNYNDMEGQIRGMQLAGLSGFPFWGHDAGGFYDWKNNKGQDENMYQRWAMAFGSFAPIWKPHGMGQSRWPLDRSSVSQQTALKFSKLRYQLMPYLYSAAHQAASVGLPIARAMILDHQSEPNAWKYDLQYMWGDSLLVAPLTADSGSKDVWLPKADWYELSTSQKRQGDQILQVKPALNELPVFVKAGAILPQRDYEVSTAFINKSKLHLSIYTGDNGAFTLTEDDDVTEAHRLKGWKQTTLMEYREGERTFILHKSQGYYPEQIEQRDLTLSFIGIDNVKAIMANDQSVDFDYTATGIKVSNLNTPTSETFVVKLITN